MLLQLRDNLRGVAGYVYPTETKGTGSIPATG